MEKPISTAVPRRVRYVPAVGHRLQKLLWVVFALFALLGANSLYLVSVTALEWFRQQTYQDYFYQYMFLVHLALGLLMVGPVVVFGIGHMANARHRPNRRAVRVGYGLFAVALLLLASGIVLTRLDAFGLRLEVKSPSVRNAAYWAHVLTPLLAVWLFVLHRLAGRRIRWRVGGLWAVVAGVFAIVMVFVHAQDPRRWNVAGPASGEQYFFPSLSRTATGDFIPARAILNDQYCLQCHEDAHKTWSQSMHRFSSFNNPAYLFSVKETRRVLARRDGSARASRFCAGCHDPVPFFTGAFDDPKFDDPSYDLAADPLAQAGITCTVCHAITNINSPRGNADYTIEEPIQYPFAYSQNGLLKWVNRQLIKAKPEFHKKTFLKPLHRTPEFCGTCHKVHIPQELNAYKFLPAQNHYDTFLLSGVSGHGVSSFYYPAKAETDCNRCHMPLTESDDFAAHFFDDSGKLKVHDHQFPSANTAIPHLLAMPERVNENHRAFLDGVMRVDLFAVKEGARIDGRLMAPIRPTVPPLDAGKEYLLETVIRTVKMGHPFTQGTADSNQIWVEMVVREGDRVIGHSGEVRAEDGRVDPWSYFVNSYVIDRDGHRVDRRNAQDIFVSLYNHQIPPGAAAVVHYRLKVLEGAAGPLTVEVKLRYRKFDTRYMKYFQGDRFLSNDLPIMTLASDRVLFPIRGRGLQVTHPPAPIPLWERWNDYGIGLLREGNSGSNRGELRQAQAAFAEVEKLGHADGALNRARVYLKEGRLDEAVAGLRQAAAHDPPALPWLVAWFTAVVNKQNGYFDEAIRGFRGLVEMDTQETRRRGFDFSKDYRLLNELGETIFERAKQQRGDGLRVLREEMLHEAARWFRQTLKIDPENVAAHYNLSLIETLLGDRERAARHRRLHGKYKPDDNARDRAVAIARRQSAPANHAAEAIVIYDLQRADPWDSRNRIPQPARNE